MITSCPETHARVARLIAKKESILAMFHGAPLSRPVFQQFKMRFFSTLKLEFPGADFDGWLTLVEDAETADHIQVKLNHERMYEARGDTPDWVYFVLWTFIPGWAPSVPKPAKPAAPPSVTCNKPDSVPPVDKPSHKQQALI